MNELSLEFLDMLAIPAEDDNEITIEIGSSSYKGSEWIQNIESRLLELSRLTELDLKVWLITILAIIGGVMMAWRY